MQLTRSLIISTAMDLIEAEGVGAATMNRLASELGCGLLPLYRRFPSRSALLDGVADALVSAAAEASGSSTPAAAAGDEATGEWAGCVRARTTAFWQTGRARPRSALATASLPPATAAMVRPAERTLAALGTAGFGGQEAVRIIRVLRAYVAGALLCEFGIAPGLTASDARPHLRAAEFPEVTGLSAELTGTNPTADFEFGLDLIMQALTARRQQ